MDDEAAISRLPKTHASALRLRARGFDDDAIARLLGLEPGAVAPLLAIADAKVAALSRPRPTVRAGEERGAPASCSSGSPSGQQSGPRAARGPSDASSC